MRAGRALASATFALIAFGGGGCWATEEGSVTYQINPAHDGSIRFKGGFAPPLKLLWSKTLEGPPSYPLVANGMLFTAAAIAGTKSTHLAAFRLTDGRQIWRRTLTDSIYAGANTAYDNGLIFAVTFSGILRAFTSDAEGTLVWSTNLTQGSYVSPIIAQNGSVYVYGASALSSVEEASGTVQWRGGAKNAKSPPVSIDGVGDGGPAFGDNGVYVTPVCNYFKLDPLTGREIWVYSLGCTGGGETSVYFHKRLYVRDNVMGDLIFNARNGKILGAFAAPIIPAFYQDRDAKQFCYALFSGNLYAVDLVTGNVVWSFSGDGQLAGPPIVINGNVVEGSASGELFLLDAETGTPLWSTNVGSPIGVPPGLSRGMAAGDGKLIVPTATDQIFVFAPEQAASANRQRRQP